MEDKPHTVDPYANYGWTRSQWKIFRQRISLNDWVNLSKNPNVFMAFKLIRSVLM